jgi:hypothetical protein
MKQVKKQIPKKLQLGIPLKIGKGHTVLLETTEEPLTVHTGLSLFYAMAEALEIPRTLDEHIHVKERERGYPESENILALAANAFIGGDFLDDLEALREDVVIQKAIGRKDIPDPTTAADFCRRFTLGHILQFNRAMAEIHENVYHLRPKMTAWTIDTDAKAHEVFGAKKEGAARNYNGIYSLQVMYSFVHETEEMLHSELRSGETQPGAKAVAYLRRMKRKIPGSIKEIYLRSDSAFYNKEVIAFCEGESWSFSITADQTAPLRQLIENVAEENWKEDVSNPGLWYGEVWYQPVGWSKPYRYLLRREKKEPKGGQGILFEPLGYKYYAVVTNRSGEVQELMEAHDRRGSAERRIGQFSTEFLSHLPLGGFMANWVYMLCAQLAYNLSYWLRDLVLPPFYRKKHIKRIRRCVGLVAAKVTEGGHQIRLKVSVFHRWLRDFAYAWQGIGRLELAFRSG